MEDQNISIVERIRGSYYQFTAAERKVADFVLARHDQIRFMSITQLADVVLCCGSNEGPFQLGSVSAKIAQLVVVDVLFQEYCHRNEEECQENVQRIASTLTGKHI